MNSDTSSNYEHNNLSQGYRNEPGLKPKQYTPGIYPATEDDDSIQSSKPVYLSTVVTQASDFSKASNQAPNSGFEQTQTIDSKTKMLPKVDWNISDSEEQAISNLQSRINKNDNLTRSPTSNKMQKAVFNLRLANSVLKPKAKKVEDVGSFPLLTSALAIPGYHFNYANGKEPPAIILEALKVKITDSTTDLDGDGQKDISYLFRIELTYGPIRWVIYRRLRDFYELHAYFKKEYYQGNLRSTPKFPNILSYTFQRAFTRSSEQNAQLSLERRKALENYLKDALIHLNMTQVKEFFAFLELSGCSIKKFMGWKGKEGYLRVKKSKTKRVGCLPGIWGRYTWGWVMIRDSYVMICKNIYDTNPSEVMLFNGFTTLDLSHTHKNNIIKHHKLILCDPNKRFEMKSDSRSELYLWSNHLQLALKNSIWTKQHRYGSFAPVRQHINMKWYVDAAGYFYDVSEAILHAKDTIYIADWWLTPELYLRRPPSQYPSFRLDRLLKKKAEQGVEIYIIVYKEIAVSLPNNSAHTKQTLKKLHHRIRVLRHPDRVQTNGTWFWAHHEKICVIDNRLAFVGGLDLCLGRYDDNAHRIADYNPHSDGSDIVFPGQDYYNARIKDFEAVQNFDRNLIDRAVHGRMPWHDIHTSMSGIAARDVARHFIQRWNFVKASKAQQKVRVPYLLPLAESSKEFNEETLKGTCHVQVLRSSSEWSSGVELESSIYNAYIDCISKAEHFIYIENQFFVSAAKGENGYTVKNQIAKALVNRIIRAHQEKKPFRVIVVMPLMPAFQSEVHEANANTIRLVMQWQYQSISRGEESIMSQLHKANIEPSQYIWFHGLRNYDFIPLSHHYKPEVEENYDKDLSSPHSTEGEHTRMLKDGLNIPKQSKGPSTPKVIDKIAIGSPIDERQDYFGAIHTNQPKKGSKSHSKDSLKKNVNSFKNILDAMKGGDSSECQSSDDDDEGKVSEENKLGKTQEQEGTPKRTNQIKKAVNAIKDKAQSQKSSDENYIKADHLNQYELTPANSTNNLPSYVQERKKYEANIPIEVIPADAPGHSVSPVKLNNENMHSENHRPANKPNLVISIDNNDTVESEVIEAASQYVTEMVYIHSKLMIIDDRIVICGSANVNDRSMVGYRDSEIAVIVEDQDFLDSTMNGEEYKVSKFAHTLRCTIFKEHLGLLKGTEMVNLINFEAGEDLGNSPMSPFSPQSSPNLLSSSSPALSDSEVSTVSFHSEDVVRDPLSSTFEAYWGNVSSYNTRAFRKVFRCVPDDTVTNWEQYRDFIPRPDQVQYGHPDFRGVAPTKVHSILSKVRGHLVEFPSKFLEQVSLEAGAFSAENIIPVDVFI